MRIGARGGPDSVRQQSALMRRFNPTQCRLRSGGGARPGRLRQRQAHAAARSSMPSSAPSRRSTASSQAGAVPITIGGDGSVTVPVARAVGKKHKKMAALHIDSHTDSYPYGRGGEVQLGHPVHPRRRGRPGRSRILLACRHPQHDLRAGRRAARAEPRLQGGVDRRAGARRLRPAHGRVPRQGRQAAGLSLLRHGRVRSVARARRLHAVLGRAAARAKASTCCAA